MPRWSVFKLTMEPTQRRLQFRLRTLMLLVAAAAVVLAIACWLHRGYQRQWRALREIHAAAVPFKLPDDIDNDNRYPLFAEQPHVKAESTLFRPFGLPVGSLGQHYVTVSILEVVGDAPAWVAVNRLDHFPDVVEIDIDGDTASDELLAGLSKLKRLQRLRIKSNSMDGTFLESMNDSENLVSLSLSSIALRDRVFLQACCFEGLEQLHLSGVKIRDAASLCELSKLMRLTRIHLSGWFPNEGLEALAKLERLDTVSLASDSLNNDGVSRLAGSSSVFSLEIYGPNIDDDVIDSIAQMPELNMLTLNYTKVTPAGVEKLKQLRPDIQVEVIAPRTPSE